MKLHRTLPVIALALLPALGGLAQEFESNDAALRQEQEAARQKLLKAADSIEDMRLKNEQLQKDLDDLRKQIEENRSRQDQIIDQISKLADAIKKVDQARVLDRDSIVEEMRKLATSLSQKPATTTPPPTTTASVASPDSSNNAPPVEEGYEHVVEKGQTLWSIAKAYKVSVDDIKKANNLKSDTLKVGQKLFVPKK